MKQTVIAEYAKSLFGRNFNFEEHRLKRERSMCLKGSGDTYKRF